MISNSKETDRTKKPSKFAIKVANTVFVLGILFSVLVALYAVYKIYNHHNVHVSAIFYYSFLLFALLTSILFGLGLRKLNDKIKVNMSVLLITVGISVYGFEIYLEFFHEALQPRKSIEKNGDSFDRRPARQVIKDLRDSGINAYPNIQPLHFIKSNGLETTKGRIYPLGMISNITTILGNELGYHPVIETDEHGFNNPKGLYGGKKVDIMLTGDSFTEGWCVHSNETISAVLRKSGFNAISIGKAGNGPLIEFAAVKEYAKPLKPKIVLWLYFRGDFIELTREMKSLLLLKYINENDFSQNLISRQEEIDGLLKRLPAVADFYSTWEKTIKLYMLRTRLSIRPRRLDETHRHQIGTPVPDD